MEHKIRLQSTSYAQIAVSRRDFPPSSRVDVDPNSYGAVHHRESPEEFPPRCRDVFDKIRPRDQRTEIGQPHHSLDILHLGHQYCRIGFVVLARILYVIRPNGEMTPSSGIQQTAKNRARIESWQTEP